MEQGYDNIYDKIKKLEKQVKELVNEYIEKQQQLDKIVEEINEKDIFTDIKKKCEPSSLERKLKIERAYLNNFEISTEFYNKYSSLWQSLGYLDSLDETEENIGILAHYIINNNDEFSDELCPFKGIAGLPFYISFDNTVYIVAAVLLRLENMRFQDIMNLVQECNDRKEQIDAIKKEIKSYKIELSSAIVDGIISKTSFVVNKTIKPTMDKVVKPSIDKSIKSLIRSLTMPAQRDEFNKKID